MPELPGADVLEVSFNKSSSSDVLKGWNSLWSRFGGSSEKATGMGAPGIVKNLSENMSAMVESL